MSAAHTLIACLQQRKGRNYVANGIAPQRPTDHSSRCLSAKAPLFVGKSTADGYKQQGYRYIFVPQELLSSISVADATESYFPMHIQLQPTNAGNGKQTSRHTLALNDQTTHAHIKLKCCLYFTKHALFSTSF